MDLGKDWMFVCSIVHWDGWICVLLMWLGSVELLGFCFFLPGLREFALIRFGDQVS